MCKGMKPLISVVIPIYGVEKYLKRAVDSVLHQTYTNLDIILVDDGSKDGCPAICDAYAAREARVRVIHKENGGLSDARNAGIAVAGGDYIAFLDSDDYYAPCFIEILYRELLRADADVAVCSYETTKELEPEKGPDFAAVRAVYEQGKADITVYDRRQMLLNQYDALCPDATYFIVAWNKLYKRSLFQEVRFPKGKIHEDEATIYRIFDRIHKGVYIRLPLYAYFEAPGSITRENFSKKRMDFMDALTDRITFFDRIGETDGKKAALRARADGAIRYFYPLRKKFPETGKALRGYVKEALYVNRHGTAEEQGFLSGSNQMGYRLFLLFPDLYYLLRKKNF